MGIKTYLGDSVYAEFTAYGAIVLTTNNGGNDSNQIYLEEEHILALVKFLEKCLTEASK